MPPLSLAVVDFLPDLLWILLQTDNLIVVDSWTEFAM